MTDLRRFLVPALACLCLATAARATPFAYLCGNNEVVAIDAATRSIPARIPLAACGAVAAFPGHRYAYAAHAGDATQRFLPQVAVLDTLAQAPIADIPIGADGLFLNPGKARLYAARTLPSLPVFPAPESLTTLSVINTDSNSVIGTVPFDGQVSAIAFHPSGTHAYLAQPFRNRILVVDTAIDQVVSIIATAPIAGDLRVHPLDNRLYVGTLDAASQPQVAVIDLNDGKTISTIPLNGRPLSMAFNPGGTRLFIVDQVHGTVDVIDPLTRATLATIAAPMAGAVDVAPPGSFAFVANLDGTVSVISVDGLRIVETVPAATLPRSSPFIGGAVVSPPEVPGVLSGLWGNAAEPGWGVHIAHRRDTVFAAWHTYDTAGAAHWYVASSCTMAKPLPCPTCVENSICSGLLYEVSGPRFFTDPFDPAGAHAREAGLVEIQFKDRDTATFTRVVDRQGKSVPIKRYDFGPRVATPAIDYTDLWFSPRESGWGVGITHRAGTMFLAWFVYDDSGRPVWLFASDCKVTAAGDGCAGNVYRASGPTGPAAGVDYDSSKLRVATAGTVTVSFTDSLNGMISWKVDGRSGSRKLVRQLF